MFYIQVESFFNRNMTVCAKKKGIKNKNYKKPGVLNNKNLIYHSK